MDGLQPIGDFAAKAAEHAARIAGVLTIVADHRATGIGMDTMAGALALAEWYVLETLRLQQAGRRDAKLLRANALLEFMQKRSGEEILLREILQFGPIDTRTKGQAEEAIDALKAHGWVVEATPRPRAFRVVPEPR